MKQNVGFYKLLESCSFSNKPSGRRGDTHGQWRQVTMTSEPDIHVLELMWCKAGYRLEGEECFIGCQKCLPTLSEASTTVYYGNGISSPGTLNHIGLAVRFHAEILTTI